MKDTAAPIPVLAARPTYIRHLVLAALCVITTINYVQRNSLAAVETRVSADLGVKDTDLGDAKSIFFLTYALCQVPSGWLAQRWGGRRMLTLYAAGWSLVMGLMAGVTTLPALLVLRAAMGALQAGIFPCCTLILASWYSTSRRGFASAVLNSFMLIGSAVASLLTGLLIQPLGWHALFVVYAVPGLLWAGWFVLWFRNQPRDHPNVNAAELSLLDASSSIAASKHPTDETSVAAPPVPWLKLLFSSALWLICLQQFCRAGAMRFFDHSLPIYLQRARGLSIEEANLWTSLPLWTGVLGGMLGGILSDWVLSRTGSRRAARQGVATVTLLLAVLVYGLAYQFENVQWAMLTAGVGVAIMTFSAPCAYALTMDMGGRNLGIIFATMNTAGNLGATAFTDLIPHVVKWRGWGAALLVFISMHVVAIMCWLLLNPNGLIGERADAASDSKE